MSHEHLKANWDDVFGTLDSILHGILARSFGAGARATLSGRNYVSNFVDKDIIRIYFDSLLEDDDEEQSW